MCKMLHKKPVCFTSARVEFSPSDSRVLGTVGNTSSLPPFTSYWDVEFSVPWKDWAQGWHSSVCSWTDHLVSKSNTCLHVRLKRKIICIVQRSILMISFFIRKFYFGLQEGIATILVRTLVCHMPASVWPFSGLFWTHLPLCTVAGPPALVRRVLHFPDRNCGWEIFGSCHFMFGISSFPRTQRPTLAFSNQCWDWASHSLVVSIRALSAAV